MRSESRLSASAASAGDGRAVAVMGMLGAVVVVVRLRDVGLLLCGFVSGAFCLPNKTAMQKKGMKQTGCQCKLIACNQRNEMLAINEMRKTVMQKERVNGSCRYLLEESWISLFSRVRFVFLKAMVLELGLCCTRVGGGTFMWREAHGPFKNYLNA